MKTYTFDSLKNYALRYYFKYFVSPKKLMQKLKEKSKDKDLNFYIGNLYCIIKSWEIFQWHLKKSKNIYIKNEVKILSMKYIILKS
jgi:hypothetical protein